MLVKWRPSEETGNFGDEIVEILRTGFTDEAQVTLDSPKTKYFLIGSVIHNHWLEYAPEVSFKDTHFWGCGYRGEGITSPGLRHTHIHGVRGLRTQEHLRAYDIKQPVIGDTALLLPLFVGKGRNHGKRIFMPHIEDPKRHEYSAKKLGVDEIVQPDVRSIEEVRALIEKISGASFVLAGAMHAGIVAYAYGRPFAFFKSERIDSPIKYEDFLSAIKPSTYVKFCRTVDEGTEWHQDFRKDAKYPSLVKMLDNSPLPVRPELSRRARAYDRMQAWKYRLRRSKRRRLFVEAGSLIDERMSGTGHVAMNIVRYLSSNQSFTNRYRIILLVAYNKTVAIDRLEFNKNVEVRRIYLPARVINGLTRFNLVPPADIFFGKGTYLFPNFKNWPLLVSRSITYIHDVAFRIYPEFIQPKNLSMLDSSIDRFLRRSDLVVTVSDSSRDETLEHFPYLTADKVITIENTVDTTLYNPQPPAAVEQIRSQYELPKQYFMFLSNIEPRKNLNTLLDAYEKIAQPGKKNPALVIVGGMGWLNNGVEQKITAMQKAGLNVIRPRVWVPDSHIPALLTGAIALVHPAYHEGFGMSPLEAMACGTPVIVSSIPAMREVAGSVGTYLKDIESADELAGLMTKVMKDRPDRKKLIARAEKFSPASSYDKLISVIQKLTNDK
jgi:glycosyltransferase involved in cell wall biosynthesis